VETTMGDLVSTGRGVPAQRDADPDLVDVGAEALGVKLMEVGPVPADPHMGLLRDLARSVLEAAADEEREAGMVATRVRRGSGLRRVRHVRARSRPGRWT
jgi:hypothetical protein